MVSKQEFQEFVRTLITDEDKEKYQKTKSKFAIIVSIALIVEAALFMVGIFFASNSTLRIALLILMVVVMFITFFVVKNKHAFNWGYFKESNMPKILEFILKGYKYNYTLNKYIPEDIFSNSPFFTEKYDEYGGEDLLSINVPNDDFTPSHTWFHISDLSVTKQEERVNYVVDKYGNTHREIDHYTVSLFKGTFAYVQFPSMFKCRIGINQELKNTKKINFEDVDFNKNLKTYSDDELNAFLVLTPDLINKLKELNKRTKGIKLAMYDNKLYLAMSHSNLFEFTKDKKEFKPSMFDGFYDDLVSVLGIVTEVKNNNKVFKF